MKKITIILSVFISTCFYAQNNVGIGTSNPNSQSILDIESSDKGVLISRLTTVSRNILGTSLTATEDGMLVYDRDLTAFYYWDGTNLQWVQVGSGAGDNWGADVVNTSGSNITGNGTSGSPIIVTEVDGDVNNEIQDLSLNTTSNILTITNNTAASSIDLSPYKDNTDAQDLTLINNVLSLSNDATTVDLSILKDHDWYEVGGTLQSDNINDAIFTQGNVGIGTIAPDVNLDVAGDVSIGKYEDYSSASPLIDNTYGNKLYFNGASFNSDPVWISRYNEGIDSTYLRFNVGDAVNITDAFQFSQNNSVIMHIQTNGNVGINTVVPVTSLDVNGGSRITEGLYLDGTNVNSGRTSIILGNNSSNEDYAISVGSPNGVETGMSINKLTGYGIGGSVQFISTSMFRITNAGDIGIGGIVTPTNKLDINGDLRVRTIVSGSSTDQLLVVDGTGVVKKVASSSLSPTGEVITFAGATAPTGFLICNGATVSRTIYADLFTVIGTTYGVGNGSTTFNLPDLRGEFIRGFDAGRGADPSRAFGTRQEGTIVSGGDDNATGQLSSVGYGNLVFGDPLTAAQLSSINGNTWIHTNDNNVLYNWTSPYSSARPRNVAMNYCIKF